MRPLYSQIALLCFAIILAGCGLPPKSPSPPAGQPSITPLQVSSPTTMIPPVTSLPTPAYLAGEVRLVQLPQGPPFGFSNSYALFVLEGHFVVYDFADPTAPVHVWQSERLGEDVWGLAASEGRAYIVADGILQIWDVTKTSHFRLIGSIRVGEEKALISDTRLYLFQQEGDRVHFLSTVDSPRELGRVILDRPVPHWLSVLRGHLYFLYDGRVDLVDISDPSIAIPRATFSLPINVESRIEAEGDYVYIGTHSGVWILDVSDPANPHLVGHYFNLPIDHLAIVGRRGFLISSICEGEVDESGQVSYGCGHGADVVDFSRPGVPNHVRYIRLYLGQGDYGYIEESRHLGHFLFLKSNTGFWYVLDLRWLEPTKTMPVPSSGG